MLGRIGRKRVGGWLLQRVSRRLLLVCGWGRSGLDEGRSLVLEVPSVIEPEEFRVLVDSLHADFGELVVGEVRDFGFDVRS